MIAADKRFMIVGTDRPYEVKWTTFCNALDYLQSRGVTLTTRRDDHSLRYYRSDTGRIVAWSEDRYPGNNHGDDEIEKAYVMR